MKPVARLLFACLLMLAVVPAFAQEGENVEIIGGDEESLRELLSRIVSPITGFDSGAATVVIGDLPEDFDLELPLPEAARIIGSVSHSVQQGSIQIFFSTSQSPEEVMEFYSSELTEPEWSEPEAMGQPSGFVGQRVEAFTRCQGEDVYVSLYAQSTGDATDVTLYVQESPQYSPCNAPQSVSPSNAPMPVLEAPEGVTFSGTSSGGGSNDQWYTSTQLTTDLSPEELAALYGQQLEEQGWTQTAVVNADTASASTWTFADEGETWNGVLVVASGEGDQLTALLQILRAN